MADFETIFVDVGQGDSTLIRLPDGEYMLVDVCRRQGDGIDLFKLLDDRLPKGEDGRLRLKYLVITHAHDDHIEFVVDNLVSGHGAQPQNTILTTLAITRTAIRMAKASLAASASRLRGPSLI